VQPTELTEQVVHRFLDSFAELCECRDNQLEGLYLGLWYRAAVTGADGAGAHLVYLDNEDTEVLGPADFEARSWRVRGGARGGDEARSSDLSPQEEKEAHAPEEDAALSVTAVDSRPLQPTADRIGPCEDCGLKRQNFGLPAEGKRRWCGGCAKAHAGSANLNWSPCQPRRRKSQ
jgi:hypothetical protein